MYENGNTHKSFAHNFCSKVERMNQLFHVYFLWMWFSRTFLWTTVSSFTQQHVILRTAVTKRRAFLLLPHRGRRTMTSLCHSKKKVDDDLTKKKKMKLSHCATICMVPPSEYEKVWEALTDARTTLKDPGLYRWPPHANLLYPFYEINKENQDEILSAIQLALEQIEPFQITLDRFGTFGGSNRGVLWLYPRSTVTQQTNDTNEDNNTTKDESDQETTTTILKQEPLIQLQSLLETHTSTLVEGEEEEDDDDNQAKKGTKNRRAFAPHMTLSHFINLQDAKEAQIQMEQSWKPISFFVSHIYYLQRIGGDDGQFHIMAKLPLGKHNQSKKNTNNKNKNTIELYSSSPQRFPAMPLVEEDWVREERMKLKKRRNGKQRRRTKSNHGQNSKTSKSNDRGPSKSTDTPEQIAAKRAARAAKKQLQLLQQQQQQQTEVEE